MPVGLLQKAIDQLAAAGVENARLDAEVLLAHAMGCGRFALYTKRTSPTESARRLFEDLVGRRADGCPVAYLTGIKEFWSIPIRVTPDVLIPRPETELVVERALACLRTHDARRTTHDGILILDLCTGSGCIAAALATELPRARVVVADISAAAIEVARTNLAFAAGRVTFLVGDLFSPLLCTEGLGEVDSGSTPPHPSPYKGEGVRFDLITANPPYVSPGEIPRLAREIVRFEPREALDGGKCGLDFAAQIIENAPQFLEAGGWLVMEMGGAQAGRLKESGERAGFRTTEISRDLAGIERVIAFRKDDSWKSSSSREAAP